jgi:L-alanine-DL-glutamate epimerase-like enolase superfamily enzyme
MNPRSAKESTIRALRFRRVTRPLRTTWHTAMGSKSSATSLIVTMELEGGWCGVGEVPTSFAVPHETPDAIREVLATARKMLVSTDIGDYQAILHRLRRAYPTFHMTLAGLEVALFRAGLAHRGEGEMAFWGARRRTLETDITIPFLTDGDELLAWLNHAWRVGFRAYKVKVSGQCEADLTLVGTVHEFLRRRCPQFTIRLDGNQGFTQRGCLRLLDRLARSGVAVELMEQPLPKDQYAALKRLTKSSPVAIILDETVFTAEQCRRVADDRLGHGVNIKIAKSGIAESAAILRIARSAGLKLMIGCMTETMIGLSAGIRLAAGTNAFDYVDLDAAHLMFGPRRQQGITVSGPRYLLKDGP